MGKCLCPKPLATGVVFMFYTCNVQLRAGGRQCVNTYHQLFVVS